MSTAEVGRKAKGKLRQTHEGVRPVVDVDIVVMDRSKFPMCHLQNGICVVVLGWWLADLILRGLVSGGHALLASHGRTWKRWERLGLIQAGWNFLAHVDDQVDDGTGWRMVRCVICDGVSVGQLPFDHFSMQHQKGVKFEIAQNMQAKFKYWFEFFSCVIRWPRWHARTLCVCHGESVTRSSAFAGP